MNEWPTGQMKALQIRPGKIETISTQIPPVTHGEVLIKVAYVGICGTDVELFNGRSYYIEQGLNNYPVIFGHEWTGTVHAVAPGVDSVVPGDKVIGQTIVTCGACPQCQAGRRTACKRRAEVGLFGRQGAAATYISMPVSAVTRLGASASLADAVLIEPGVTAMSAITRTDCRFDDRVAVIGTGTLGLLAAAIARHVTPSVDAIGIEEPGLELARQMGVRQALRPDEVQRDSYSVVVEASGAPSSVAMLGTMLEPGGRAALVGVVNAGTPDFVPAFVTLKGISLFGILHGLPHYERVGNLITSGVVRTDTLVDRILPWREADKAFSLMINRELVRPKVLIDMNDID